MKGGLEALASEKPRSLLAQTPLFDTDSELRLEKNAASGSRELAAGPCPWYLSRLQQHTLTPKTPLAPGHEKGSSTPFAGRDNGPRCSAKRPKSLRPRPPGANQSLQARDGPADPRDASLFFVASDGNPRQAFHARHVSNDPELGPNDEPYPKNRYPVAGLHRHEQEGFARTDRRPAPLRNGCVVKSHGMLVG